MKRLILASSFLTICLTPLTIVSPVTLAGDLVPVSTRNPITTAEIQPFNLVYRTYNGDFSNQGMPSFNRLTTAFQTGQIQAKNLVKAAINEGRLSQDALSDQAYLNAVNFQLRNFQINGNGNNR